MSSRVVSAALYWSLIESGTSQLLGAGLFLVLARLLTPSDYGVVAIAQALIVLLQLVAGFGASQLVVRAAADDQELHEVVFTINLAGSIAAFAVIVIGEVAYHLLFGSDSSVMLLHIALAATMPVMSLYVVNQALLIKEMNFRAGAIRAFLSQAIAGSAGIAAALYGLGPWSLVIWRAGTVCIEGAICWLQRSWRMRLNFRSRRFKGELRNGLKITFVQIVSVLDHRLTEIVVAYSIGLINLAVYTISRKLFDLVTQLTFRPFLNISLTLFSERGDHSNLRNLYCNFNVWLAWASFPISVVAYFSSDFIIHLVLGQKWFAAIAPFKIVIFSIPSYVLIYIYEPILISQDRLRDLAILRVLQSVLVLSFGLVGMLLFQSVEGTIAGQVVGVTIFSLIVLRTFFAIFSLSFGEFVLPMLGVTACGIVAIVFCVLVEHSAFGGLARVFMTTLGTAIIFGAGFSICRPLPLEFGRRA